MYNWDVGFTKFQELKGHLGRRKARFDVKFGLTLIFIRMDFSVDCMLKN